MMRSTFSRLKPSFLIIGAQKAGTTSLFKYLEQHKRLVSSNPKEVHFFDNFDTRDINLYHSHFPKKKILNKLAFEATPRYLYFPGTSKRLKEYNPKLKLIILLRNPVNRAFSAWNMYQQMKNNPNLMLRFKQNSLKFSNHKIYDFLIDDNLKSFRDWYLKEITENKAKDLLEPSVLKRGHYQEQILEYLEYFPINQICFVDSNELQKNTFNEVNRICDFLEISRFKLKKVNLQKYHKREYSSNLKDSDKYFLNEYYQNKNQQINEITGLDFKWS